MIIRWRSRSAEGEAAAVRLARDVGEVSADLGPAHPGIWVLEQVAARDVDAADEGLSAVLAGFDREDGLVVDGVMLEGWSETGKRKGWHGVRSGVLGCASGCVDTAGLSGASECVSNAQASRARTLDPRVPRIHGGESRWH